MLYYVKQNKKVSGNMINSTKVCQEKWSVEATDYGMQGSLPTSNPNMRPKAVSNEFDYGNRSFIPRTVKVNSAPTLAADNGELYYRQPSSEYAKGRQYQTTIFGSSSRDNWRNTSGQKQNKNGIKVYDLRDNIQKHRKHSKKRSTRSNHVDSKVASSSSPQVIIGNGWSVKRRGGKKRTNYSSRYGGPVPISALIPEKIREDHSVFHTAYKDECPTSSNRGWNSSLIPNKMKWDYLLENPSPTHARSRRNVFKRQGNREGNSVGDENVQIVKKKRKERRKGSSRKKHKKRSNQKFKRDNLSLNYLDMINPNKKLESQRSNLIKMQHQSAHEECSISGNENIEESDVKGKTVAERRIDNGKGAWRKKNRSTLKNSRSYGGFGTLEPFRVKDWFKRAEKIRSLSEERHKKEENTSLILPETEPEQVPDNEFPDSPKATHNLFEFLDTNTQHHRKKESYHDEFLAPYEKSSKSGNLAVSLEDVRNERKSMIVLNNGRLWPLPMRQNSAPLHSRRRSSSKSKVVHRKQQSSSNLENCLHHKNYHEQEKQPKLKKLSKAERRGKRRRTISAWKKKPPRRDHGDKTDSRRKHGHRKNISAPPVIREIPKGFFTRTFSAKSGIKEFQCVDNDVDIKINLTKSRKSDYYGSENEIPSNPLSEDDDRELAIASTGDASGCQHIDLGIFDVPTQINHPMSQHNSDCSENRNQKNESRVVAREEFDVSPIPLNQEEGKVKASARNQCSSNAQNSNKWSLILTSTDSENGSFSSENYLVSKSDPRSPIAPNQTTLQCSKGYDPEKGEMNNWKSCWDEEWIKQSSREGVKIDFKQVTHDSSSNNHHTSDTEETVVRLVSHSEKQVSSMSRTQINEPARQHPKQNADQIAQSGVVSRTVSSSWPNAWSQQETSGMLLEEMQPARQQQTLAKWRILE